MKIAADVIDKPLHHIISLSIQQQKFPSSWKFSKIVPLHKKQSRLEKANYRPVSILSPLSKILEKVVYQQIYDYFARNKILHQDMHGYRQNRSTCTALLSMYNRWITAASKGQISGVVLLDLSAAFDLVNWKLLLKKFEIYGLDKDFLAWITSYLTNRYQSVWIDHTFSDLLQTETGVPQGSNLGPLFFMVFFNDLMYKLNCADNYADDTTLTEVSSSLDELEQKLTESCDKVTVWMRSNQLKLNASKTHILTIGTSQKLRTLQRPMKLTMDEVELREDALQNECLLGCFVSRNLKWHDQIEQLLMKLRSRLNGLQYLRHVGTFTIRKRLAEGIFNSVLCYCMPLFGGTEIEQLKNLQVMQNKAASIVCGSPPGYNRKYLFDQTQWMTVNQLVWYHTLVTVFRIRGNREPEYLSELLNVDSRNGRIVLPKFDLLICQKSFTYRGASKWNKLPEKIRELEKINCFKKSIKVWILSNVDRFLD